MNKLSFDITVNSSDFLKKTEQIRSAIRATAQEIEEQGEKVGESFMQIAVDVSMSAGIVTSAFKSMQEQISESVASLSALNAENQQRLEMLRNAATAEMGGLQEKKAEPEINARENLSADIENQRNELVRLDAEITGYQEKIKASQGSVFEGVSAGLDGLSSAFGTASSVLKMFSVENDTLQSVMEKVQLAIAVTNGLQEVNTALSKESAFQINVVGRLKLWWRTLTLQAASAQGVETVAKTAGTVANWSLATSFRAIGLAIKSIPVFGWILAGISALIAIYSAWSSQTKEQEQEQARLNQTVREFNDGIQGYAAKPVAMIELLSAKFKALGNDMDAQKKFVADNKKAFDELGVSINSVKDAQQLLIDNKDKFVQAQIDKAISLVYADKMQEEAKKLVEAKHAQNFWKSVVEDNDKKTTSMVNGIPVRQGKKPANKPERDMLEAQGMLAADGNILRNDEKKEKFYTDEVNRIQNRMNSLGKMSLFYSMKSDNTKNEILPDKKPVVGSGNNSNNEKKEKIDEAHKKHMEALAQQESELTRFTVESTNRTTQAEIDTLADGPEKKFKQLELNQRKEREALDKEKAEYIKGRTEAAKAVFDANEEYLKAQNSSHEIATFDVNTVDKGDINEEFETRDKALKAKQLNERLAYFESERQAMDEYLKDLATYEEKRAAIIALGESKKAGKKDDTEKGLIDQETNKSLADLDIKEAENSTAFSQLFSNVKDRSIKDMRIIVDEAQKTLEFIEGGNWDAEKGKEFGIKKESFDALQGAPEEIAKIKKNITEMNTQANTSNTALDKLSDGFEKVFSSDSDPEKLKAGLDEIGGALNEVMQSTKFFADSLSTLGESFDSEALSGAAEGINVAMDAASGAMSGAQAGAALGPWGAAAGAAIGLVSSLSSSLAKLHDAKNEKNIQRIQEQIEVLEKSYENLGESLDRAFSSDASALIDQQNTLLEQQKVLIRNQIAEEQNKKKADQGRIEDWQNQIEEIDKVIAGNNEKKIDVIFGEDVKSAIENFAQAYAEAWSAGDDRAKSSKDLVKGMIKQMISEAIKAASSKPMEELRKKLAGYFSDGIISDWERGQIEKDAEAIMNDLDKQFGWADQYMKGEEEATSQESTKGGFTSMSQETGDELNGRFTALQVSNEEIKNSMFFVLGNLNSLCNTASNGNILLTEMRNLAVMSNGHLEDIAKYTKVMLGFGDKLDNIATNTKSLISK